MTQLYWESNRATLDGWENIADRHLDFSGAERVFARLDHRRALITGSFDGIYDPIVGSLPTSIALALIEQHFEGLNGLEDHTAS
jgi:hypothetical protein